MSRNVAIPATWMKEQFDRDGCLYQDEAASEIQMRHGEEYVYINDAGNLAIAKDVLAAFRKLTERSAVWVLGERQWRTRIETDGPGRNSE